MLGHMAGGGQAVVSFGDIITPRAAAYNPRTGDFLAARQVGGYNGCGDNMNGIVKTFGSITSRQVAKAPLRARRLLRWAYRLTGAQARFFPRRRFLRAREGMMAAATASVANAMRQTPGAAIVNAFLPCEILHAMDIRPMFPEGMAVYFTAAASEQPFVEAAERAGVPESYCSYHKVLIGAAVSGVLPAPDVVLHTTLACDANRLTFARLAEHYGVPRFCIDVPNRETPQTIIYVANQLREMAAFLQQHTGRRLDEDALQAEVARSQRTILRYREYLRLRADTSVPTDMTGEMLPLFSNHVLLGSQAAEQYAHGLVRDIQRLAAERKPTRILWMHTMPNWQAALNDLFHRHRDLELVGCDLAYDALVDIDPRRPYEAMAQRLLANTLNGPAERRIDATLQMARQLAAGGVIYYNHWGCKSTMGAAQLAKKKLEANGFPTLVLDGDGCDSGNVSDGQQVTRVQAFLEQLGA